MLGKKRHDCDEKPALLGPVLSKKRHDGDEKPALLGPVLGKKRHDGDEKPVCPRACAQQEETRR